MNADLFGDMPQEWVVVPARSESATDLIAASASQESAGTEFQEKTKAAPQPQTPSVKESKSIAVNACPETASMGNKPKGEYGALPVVVDIDDVPGLSIERILAVLAAHGVTDNLPAGSLRAITQLVTEAQNAPAGLPPADKVLCWVMDSELSKFAPTRVKRALDPYGVNNGERMYPLFAPAIPAGA